MSTTIVWAVFVVTVFSMLFLDLCVFHKQSSEPNFRSSLKICLSYMFIAFLFGFLIWYEKGRSDAILFWTGYLVEFSLSMDNIFVISLIFTSLSIPKIYQHRVLFWGVLGAVIMRAVMIALGSQLVDNFHWVLYVFSVFLIWTGSKMLLSHNDEEKDIKSTKLYRFMAKKFSVTSKLHNEHFIVNRKGKHYVTPLLLALVLIEFMDVIFAIDSIPAIFLITTNVMIVYTSNIFAILGLRSLYFLLSEATNRFRYLKVALPLILIFIGAKIFSPLLGFEIDSVASLLVVFSLIGGSILLSLRKA